MAMCKALDYLKADNSYLLEDVEIIMRNDFLEKTITNFAKLDHFVLKVRNSLKRDFKNITRERKLFMITQMQDIRKKMATESEIERYLTEMKKASVVQKRRKKEKMAEATGSDLSPKVVVHMQCREAILRFKYAISTRTEFAMGTSCKSKEYGCKVGVKVRSKDFYAERCATQKKGSEFFFNWKFKISNTSTLETMEKTLQNCARMCILLNPKTAPAPSFGKISAADVEIAWNELNKQKETQDGHAHGPENNTNVS